MNAKKAKAIRKQQRAEGIQIKPIKEPTPWYFRKTLTTRQGNGRDIIKQAAGTPVSEKRLERLMKKYQPELFDEQMAINNAA